MEPFMIPDLPFSGPNQAEPGFISSMQQSLASPFNPSSQPTPVASQPPSGNLLDKIIPMAGVMLSSMSPQGRSMLPMFMQMQQVKRKQQGLQKSAQALAQVQQSLTSGNLEGAEQIVTNVMPDIQPEHATMLKSMMERIDQFKQNQSFSQGISPALKASGALERPEIQALAPVMSKLSPDKQLDLLKQFGLTPHVHEGTVFFTNPLSGPANVAPQPLPTAAKPDQFKNFEEAILQAGFSSVSDFTNKLNLGDSQAIVLATQLPSQQFALEKKQAGELGQQQANIQLAKETTMLGRQKAAELSNYMAKLPFELEKSRQQGAAALEMKPLEAGQQEKLDTYLQAEGLTSRLLAEFTPEERKKYAGLLGTKMTRSNVEQAIGDAMGQQADPKYAKFGALLNTFKATQAYALGGKTLPGNEASIIFGMIPTGTEWSFEQFEEKLKLSHQMSQNRVNNMTGLSGPRKNIPGYVEKTRKEVQSVPLITTPIQSEAPDQPASSQPPTIEIAPGLKLRKKGQ